MLPDPPWKLVPLVGTSTSKLIDSTVNLSLILLVAVESVPKLIWSLCRENFLILVLKEE